MSGNRFKSRVDKLFRRHIPAHMHAHFNIIYYIEWRADSTIQFVMWSKDGTIPFVALRALSEMFNTSEVYVINYKAQTNRIPEVLNYRGEFTYWSPRQGNVEMEECELFVIQIKNADFTKVFTYVDEEEISDEAKRFEIED